MGITERREREKERRTNDIIDAAERVFFSKGLNNSTMDDVAAEAELSKGTLYLYFKNKEELYRAIHLRGFIILTTMFKQAVAGQSTGLEQARAIGQAYLMFSREQPNYYNALVHFDSCQMVPPDEPDLITTEYIEKGHDALDIVIQALRNGIDDGSIRPDIDPVKTAVILWGQTTGLIQLIALKGDHLAEYHHLPMDELLMYSFQLVKRMLEA
jgi:TetR/AcrR family transcriptional regulator